MNAGMCAIAIWAAFVTGLLFGAVNIYFERKTSSRVRQALNDAPSTTANFSDAVNAALTESARLGKDVPFSFGSEQRVAHPNGTFTEK